MDFPKKTDPPGDAAAVSAKSGAEQRFFEKNRSGAITAVVLAVLLVNTAVGSASAFRTAKMQSETAQLSEQTPDTPETADEPISVQTFDEPQVQEETADSPDEPETVEEPEPPPPPEKHVMKFPHITQSDKMLTGCEIVSTSMVLSYYGKDKITLNQIYKNMNRGDVHVDKDGKWYGMSPDMAFIGNPHEYSGMGCYPPVVKGSLDNFLFDDISAQITTGTPLEELSFTYTANDIPVLLWVTTGMIESEKGSKWSVMNEYGELTGEKFVWPLHEHCVVLVGYDKKYYYLSDPLDSRSSVKYEKKLVDKRYKELGSMSLAVVKTEGSGCR